MSFHAVRMGCLSVIALLTVAMDAGAQAARAEWLLLLARTSASVAFSSNTSSNQARKAFAPALGLAYAGAGRLAARAELAVVQKGFERTEPTAHWTYVELPVMLEARFRATQARIRPTVQLGVAPSVALTCSVSYVGVAGAYHGSCYATDPLHLVVPASHWDVGALAGAGVRIRLGSGTLLLHGRYTRGMHHIERTSAHRVWSLGLGAALPLAP